MSRRGAAATYAIRVEGHLDDHWSDWLGGLDMTRDADGATTVTVLDQAQLHGVLTGLRDIGAVICELHTRPLRRPVLDRPLHTERLILRPATAADAGPTWTFRHANEWLTGCPADRDGYRALFAEPARLATTVVATLREDAAAVIGDFTLRREAGWAELGWVLDPAYAREAVRELLRYCFEELGLRRVAANCCFADETSWRA